jgi:hypothetical protein
MVVQGNSYDKRLSAECRFHRGVGFLHELYKGEKRHRPMGRYPRGGALRSGMVLAHQYPQQLGKLESIALAALASCSNDKPGVVKVKYHFSQGEAYNLPPQPSLSQRLMSTLSGRPLMPLQ